MLMTFDVIVRRDDGQRILFFIPHETRFLAARLAEEMASATDGVGAQAERVCVALSRELCDLGETPDEAQAPVEQVVKIADARGVVRCGATWAAGRREAINRFERDWFGDRVVAVRTVFRCVGRCDYCGVALFGDMKTRRAGGVLKCLDCW